MAAILQTPETWVTLSLVLFFAILAYFGVHRTVVGLLDRRADEIRLRIEEARKLRSDASDLVQQYQDELENEERAARDAIEQAKRDAETARRAAMAEFRATLERRLAAAEERIRQAEIAARKDIRNHAIDIAVAAATEVVRRSLSGEERRALLDRGIEDVRARLN